MLAEIKNIKLRDFPTLSEADQEAYERVLRYMKGKPHLGRRKARNVYEMPFAEVELMRNGIGTEEGFLQAMCLLFDCPKEMITDYRLTQFFAARNHMLSQIEHISNMERLTLSREPDPKLIEAGIKELDRFGALNILDQLGREYGKSPEEIEQWSYGLVYSLMWKRRIESDIDEKRAEQLKRR